MTTQKGMSLPVKLLIGIAVGILLGLFLPEKVMVIVVTLKYVMNQLIMFCVPLIVIGFIAPSITKMGSNATRMLLVAIAAAYVSTVLATAMSMAAGYILVPHLPIASTMEGLKDLPGVAFQLDIPQIMPVMSALVPPCGPRPKPSPWCFRSSRTSFSAWSRRSSFPFCPCSSP